LRRASRRISNTNEIATQPATESNATVQNEASAHVATGETPSDGTTSTAQETPTPPNPMQTALAMLLSRGDGPAVQLFLEHVKSPATSADALNCLAYVSNPPIGLLFQNLAAPDSAHRAAAARVLGRLNQPEITQQLIAMIARGVYRQEALIGLLSSCDDNARQFLANAAQNPLLAATLWNAQRQFQNLN
jgi:hypothetical protein